MATFKLCISDNSSGKTFQKEIKDNDAKSFIGMNIGESVKGEVFGADGYEFLITGGSDNCGFPMRRGILGIRNHLTLLGGVVLSEKQAKGNKKKKTVCGQKIHEKIVQINLKATKAGQKPLPELLGLQENKEAKKEGE